MTSFFSQGFNSFNQDLHIVTERTVTSMGMFLQIPSKVEAM